MTRISPPLLGYNNNVRYLGRTFHIQTEDSGIKYARIMTHLFIDGGRIVKSIRTEYGAVVGQPDMAETLRRMMKDQHKNMFLSLRAGEFDEIIERVTAGGSATQTSEPVLSRVPQLRTDLSLPPLSFVAGEEPKTLPGMSILEIERGPQDSGTERVASVIVPDESVQTELRKGSSGQIAASLIVKRPSVRPHKGSSGQSAAPLAVKRPSGCPRKAKSSFPPGASQTRPQHGTAPSEHLAPATTSTQDRPSERPSRKLVVRPATQTQDAIDPRSQSIFGDATAGKQTLDEVILSFLEDEEA